MSDIIADIVMPVWNCLDITKRAVALIRANTVVPYRLIMSDGASTDGTSEWLRAQKDITALIAKTNEGTICAYNRGLEICTAPYIVTMNNDVEISGKGWLRLLIEALENNPAAGTMSAIDQCGPPGINPSGAVVVSTKPAGIGGCTVMKREVVQAVGLWDERFAFSYNGDTDWAYRLRLLGWQFGIHHGVIARHPGGHTYKHAGRYEEAVALGKELFREKWPNVNWANPWG